MSSLIIINWALCVRPIPYYDFDWTIRFNENITHSKRMYSTQFHLEKKTNHSIYWFCFCCIQFVGHICQICLKQKPTIFARIVGLTNDMPAQKKQPMLWMWFWKFLLQKCLCIWKALPQSSQTLSFRFVYTETQNLRAISHAVVVRNPCEFDIFHKGILLKIKSSCIEFSNVLQESIKSIPNWTPFIDLGHLFR